MSNALNARIRLIALAYVLAISLPPFGLITGIVLIVRSGSNYSKHGIAVIVLSILVAAGWVAILTSGGFKQASTSY